MASRDRGESMGVGDGGPGKKEVVELEVEVADVPEDADDA